MAPGEHWRTSRQSHWVVGQAPTGRYKSSMSRLFAFLTLLAWALWLGGLITLFICVITLFHHNKSMAIDIAPRLFVNFERYQLGLAAVSLTVAVAWRITSKNLLVNWIFLLLCLSALGAIASPLYFSKQMEVLRVEGKTSSPKFQALHDQSTWVYETEAAMLLIASLPLFVALRRPLIAPPPPVEKT
jgi:hypothetical protein